MILQKHMKYLKKKQKTNTDTIYRSWLWSQHVHMINILEIQIKRDPPVWNLIISTYFYIDISLHICSLQGISQDWQHL